MPAAEPTAPSSSSSGPVIQHQLGATRVTIAQKFRTAAVARPSTFESTDYRYVMSDLRRVVVVAGSLLMGLIVLSFIIR